MSDVKEPIKDLNYFFNNVGLYKKEKFKIFNSDDLGILTLNEEEFEKVFNYLGISNEKIIANCIECGQLFPFKINRQWYNQFGNSQSIIIDISDSIYLSFGYRGEYGIVTSDERLTSANIYKYTSVYIDYYFNCTNEYKHVYTMRVLLELKNNILYVSKVGAYPSIQDVIGFDFEKYKKYLNKINAIEDYKSAELSFADGYFVGSYAYLRRVFEKIIVYYLNITDGNPKSNKVEDKIKHIKKNFDPRINSQLTNLYGILSQGIHELEEDECKDYYEFLKGIIDMQLLYEKNKDEVEEQTSFFTRNVSNIATKLKGKFGK